MKIHFFIKSPGAGDLVSDSFFCLVVKVDVIHYSVVKHMSDDAPLRATAYFYILKRSLERDTARSGPQLRSSTRKHKEEFIQPKANREKKMGSHQPSEKKG